MADVRVIVTPHGMLSDWAMTSKIFKKRLFTLILKILRKKTIFQSLTTNEEIFIRKYFPHAEVVTIGNPIANQDLPSASSVRTGVISLGRLCPQKNSIEFCETIARLSERSCQLFNVDVFGWSNDADYLRQFLNMSKNLSNIKYCGELSHNDVLSTLCHYKFFIIYSNFEGFPMAVLEALAAGCIVIGNETSGLDDLTCSRNVKVVPGNLTEFVLGAKKIMDQEIAYDVTDTVLDQYTPQLISKNLLQLYRR
ncbi:glycosyltransferase family 4 protein [Planktomarina temperata]|nr:glycosyltransferase family 4 protein [Planktomarina temperata]